jgi:hypothetical protein
MKTNNQKSQKSKVKNSTDKSIESQCRRKLLALQGKVTWEGDLDEMVSEMGVIISKFRSYELRIVTTKLKL